MKFGDRNHDIEIRAVSGAFHTKIEINYRIYRALSRTPKIGSRFSISLFIHQGFSCCLCSSSGQCGFAPTSSDHCEVRGRDASSVFCFLQSRTSFSLTLNSLSALRLPLFSAKFTIYSLKAAV